MVCIFLFIYFLKHLVVHIRVQWVISLAIS